jgi:tetratricopeptide (TPR) repeat protein
MEDEAEQCFLKAIEHRPDIPELWHYCGEIALHREELELSKERFERAGLMNRNNRHVWMPLTRKFYGRGDYESAAQCLDHLRDLESYLPDLWVEFFQVYEKAGQAEAFLARIQRLLETEQSPNRHWDTLADIYEGAGMQDQAAACREKLEPDRSIVLQAEPEPDPAMGSEDTDSGVAVSAGEDGQGAALKSVVSVNSVHPRVEEEVEPQYLQTSKPAPMLLTEEDPADGKVPGSASGAVAQDTGPQKTGPQYPEDPWIDQGEAHLKAGRVDEALASLTRAMQEDIPRYRAWFRMGTLFYALEKLDEAENAFRAAIERNPDVAKVWYNLGVCQAEQGKLGAARETFRRVLALDRRFAKAWDWLGLLQFNAGEYLPARRSFVRCLAVDRKSANGWHNLGMLYRAMGRHEESAHCLEQSRKLGGVEEKERFSPMEFFPGGLQ